ncbi:MarR family winged helix-turn-helix transcriptional regulator [Actinomadura luteofluorescens]
MSEEGIGAGASVDADLETMIQLLGRLVRGLKGGREDAEELIGEVRAAGLGPRHVPALMQLVLHGPVPVGVLAGHMALSPATVSQLVGELERGGFVERRPDERDRRRMIISLSARHREMIERFAWRRLRPLRVTLETLAPDERSLFLHGWRVLVEAMERADPEAAPRAAAPGRRLSRGA